MLLFATVFLASCLEDGDNDITYYSDTAITSFSVTNFNTYHTTTSSKGEDSIYKVKEDGMKYKFYIDQKNNEIYNPDSLPVGTDAKHVICAISTARGGNLFLKSVKSDSLQLISLTDSLDFSSNRVIKVISLDGKYERSYKVKVNVHKQLADQFIWHAITTQEVFAKADDIKLVVRGKDLVAFVKNGDKTEIYTSLTDSPKTWNKNTATFAADAYKNAITAGGMFYIMSEGKIYCSDNAADWTEKTANAEIVRLAGSNNNDIYALTANGIIISNDGASTWQNDMLADNSALLPQDEISMFTYPVKTNAGINRVAIIGNRNEASDKYAMVWNRLIDETTATETHMWNYVEQTSKEKFRLPRLKGLKVVSYAGGMYAMGGEPLNGDKKAFDQIYFSKDGGITWLKDKRFIFPIRFICNNAFAIATDDANNIWLICGESGLVWRGRLNGLAWETPKVE